MFDEDLLEEMFVTKRAEVSLISWSLFSSSHYPGYFLVSSNCSSEQSGNNGTY